MHLKLTEVVAQEIVRHRMKPVLEAIARFEGASRDLHRLARLDMTTINSLFECSKAQDLATSVFRKEIEEYAARCRGAILARARPTSLYKHGSVRVMC